MKFFQKHGEMKRREAMQRIENSVDDIGEKLKDLRKLELLKYNGHGRQYQISDEEKNAS